MTFPQRDRAPSPDDQSSDAPPRRDDHPGDGAARGTIRMEAFADAVFAIAMTLPIVHFDIPEPGPDYGIRLLALWPSYLGYAL